MPYLQFNIHTFTFTCSVESAYIAAPKVHKEPSQTYWAQLKQELQEPDDLDLERPPTPINLRTPTPTDLATPSYEEQIDKYGWRAEVHGDPYNLK